MEYGNPRTPRPVGDIIRMSKGLLPKDVWDEGPDGEWGWFPRGRGMPRYWPAQD